MIERQKKINTLKMRKLRFLVIIISLLVIMFASYISAFSVAITPYMPNEEIRLAPGNVKEIKFILQNKDPVDAKATVIEGSEIFQLTDEKEIYRVNPGEQVPVNGRITIPAAAQLGQIYTVNVEFKTAIASQEGSFTFGSAIGQQFKIIVVEEQKETSGLSPISAISTSTTWLLAIIIGIIILAIIVWLILKRKSK